MVCDRLWRNTTPEHLAVKSLGFDSSDVIEFARALKESGYWSVDSFLAAETDWLPLGKGAIAAALLKFEKRSPLFPPCSPKSSWYQWLVNTILAPTYEPQSIGIITFNYDRSLEFYLQRVVVRRKSLSDEDALEWINDHLRIVHVHGSLGTLASTSRAHVPYDKGDPIQHISRAARSITVLPEARDDSTAFQRARGMITNSQVVDIVGFGFADDNLRRLGLSLDAPVRLRPGGRIRIRATTKGLPEKRWRQLQRQLFSEHLLLDPTRRPWDVGRFFNELG